MSEHALAEFRPKPRTLLVCYAVLLGIALLPVFAIEIAPLGDWPNHLARAYILDRLPMDAALQKYYATQWRLFAFQSTDLILPSLIHWFGLAGANIYIASTFLLLVAGTAAVHRALFGRFRLWPAFATLFLFNLPLAVGQVSFLLATALSLLLFAGWIATEQRRGLSRIAVFSFGALALFFCHPFALACYAVTVVAFEARSSGKRDLLGRLRRMAEAGLQFIVPGAAFLFAFNSSISGPTDYGSILAKPVAWMAATVTYATVGDIVVTVAIAGAFWFLDKRKLLYFAPEMQSPAIVLLLLAVAMPYSVSGVLGADIRIPCLLAFLLMASSDVKWRSRRQMTAFVIGVAALLSFRVVMLTEQWRGFETDYREFRAADQVLDRGSRVMAMPPAADYRDRRRRSLAAYSFLASFAVIDRDVLLPQLYTIATPLRFSPAADAIIGSEYIQPPEVHWDPSDALYEQADPETVRQVNDVARYMSPRSAPGHFIDWSDWPERFDYLIDFHFGRPGNPVPALLSEVARGSYFTIYRIHPPGR